MLIGHKIMNPVQFICSADISEVKLSCQVCAYLLSDWFHKLNAKRLFLLDFVISLPSHSLGDHCKRSLILTPTKTVF